MRFIVFGTGAVGGVVGGRLAQHGHDVLFIGRPSQSAAIRKSGLRIEAPEAAITLPVCIVEHPAQIDWAEDDVVFLAMKTQDTARALDDLVAVAPADVPVVCMQNGVENERIALRWFPHVYGVCVMCPATYLTPGVVQASWSPTTGILDIGRYPSGVDIQAGAISAALQSATFISKPRPDIMRWKYGKLLMSVGNSLAAICGPASRSGPIAVRARNEAIACLNAAGIDYVSDEEDAARRSELPRSSVTGQAPRGGSSWQSLVRKTASIESGYLNGEIALLGRLHGIPTPVNQALQRVATNMARERKPPGSRSLEDIMALFPSID